MRQANVSFYCFSYVNIFIIQNNSFPSLIFKEIAYYHSSRKAAGLCSNVRLQRHEAGMLGIAVSLIFWHIGKPLTPCLSWCYFKYGCVGLLTHAQHNTIPTPARGRVVPGTTACAGGTTSSSRDRDAPAETGTGSARYSRTNKPNKHIGFGRANSPNAPFIFATSLAGTASAQKKEKKDASAA